MNVDRFLVFGTESGLHDVVRYDWTCDRIFKCSLDMYSQLYMLHISI